jgi:enoyl-CoA hydratase/carnithine racemase
MTELVLLDRPADGVAVVTLNRPAKYNALSAALIGELGRVLTGLAAEPGLRAVVLTGADPAFCAGLDLVELGAGVRFPPDGLQPLLDLGVPVIGAINGVAITGGLELAMACDLRVGSERARFADTHARLGVTPGWGLSARLPEAVGQAWARQMSMTGDFVDAPAALRIGLINELVPHDELLGRAVALASSVTSTDSGALGRILGLYDIARDQGAGRALEQEQVIAAGRELVSDPGAFAARRAAVFARGRSQAREE